MQAPDIVIAFARLCLASPCCHRGVSSRHGLCESGSLESAAGDIFEQDIPDGGERLAQKQDHRAAEVCGPKLEGDQAGERPGLERVQGTAGQVTENGHGQIPFI
jgi:hypothetical protein